MKTRPEVNFRIGEREMKILSVKVAEFLVAQHEKETNLKEAAQNKKAHQKDDQIHHLIQHLTYYN